jgi:hypothetical protein
MRKFPKVTSETQVSFVNEAPDVREQTGLRLKYQAPFLERLFWIFKHGCKISIGGNIETNAFSVLEMLIVNVNVDC